MKSKRQRPKFVRKVTCRVCGDVANDHVHYGGIVCYSCKAFFRRKSDKRDSLTCKEIEKCTITVANRKKCKACRLQKCFEVGLSKEWIMTRQDKEELDQARHVKAKETVTSSHLTPYQLRLR